MSGWLAFVLYAAFRTGEADTWFRAQHGGWRESFDAGVHFVSEIGAFVTFSSGATLGDLFFIATAVARLAGLFILYRVRLPAIYTIYTVAVLVPALTSASPRVGSTVLVVAFPIVIAAARWLREEVLWATAAMLGSVMGLPCCGWHGSRRSGSCDARRRVTGRGAAAAAGLPAVLVPLALYVVSRVMTLFAAAVAMALRPGATFTTILASWDGTWYELIVKHGYPSVIPAHHGKAILSQIPFFPLYPLLVRVVDWVTPGGTDMTGIVVSLVLGAIATVMFWYLCRSFWGDTVALRGAALFCFFPGAWVFTFAYSEGLMIILAIGDARAAAAAVPGCGPAWSVHWRRAVGRTRSCWWGARWSRPAIAIYERREWRSLIAPVLMPLGALSVHGVPVAAHR